MAHACLTWPIAVVLLAAVAGCPGVVSASSSSFEDTFCYVPRRIADCGTKVCNATTQRCMRCDEDSQCRFPAQVCSLSDGSCVMQPVGDTQGWRLAVGALAGVVICTVGVLAGVGGGGAMTPSYAGFVGLPLDLAVTASLSSIFGQGLLNVPYLAPQAYPGKPRPLINYTILTLWYPITAFGTLLGAHFNHAVPEWFRNATLIVVAFFVSIRVGWQAWKARQRERSEQQSAAHPDSVVVGSATYTNLVEDDPAKSNPVSGRSSALHAHGRSRASSIGGDPEGLATTPVSSSESSSSASSLTADDSDSQPDHAGGQSGDHSTRASKVSHRRHHHHHHHHHHHRSLAQRFPPLPIASLLGTMLTVTIARYAGHKFDCGSAGYWLALVFGGSILAAVFIAWRVLLSLRFRAVDRANKVITETGLLLQEAGQHPVATVRQQSPATAVPDVENTVKATYLFPLLSSAAGFCSATVGIGGGTLINPLLIEAGLAPEEASACGGIFTFLIALESTLSAVLHPSASHALSIAFIAFFCAIGFVSTVLGRLVLLPFFKRRGWTSVIVVALALSLILTFLAVGIYGGMGFAAMAKYDVPLTFSPLCPKN